MALDFPITLRAAWWFEFVNIHYGGYVIPWYGEVYPANVVPLALGGRVVEVTLTRAPPKSEQK